MSIRHSYIHVCILCIDIPIAIASYVHFALISLYFYFIVRIS